jgi:AcrR family transcriptional regulator
MSSSASATHIERAGTRRTQAERRSQSEGALLDAAIRLFAEKGIDQTSLAEIGEEAGYSRGLVNHHFGSKAALVERLAERTQQDFVAGLRGKLGEATAMTADAVAAAADAYFAAVMNATAEAQAFFVMWGAAIPSGGQLRPVFVASDARFRGAVEAIVRAGQERGTVAGDVDPAAFAVVFAGLVRGSAVQFLVSPGDVDLKAARAECGRLIRAALAPAPRARLGSAGVLD